MSSMMEKKLSSQSIYNGRILNLRLDEVELPNGNRTKREVVEYAGAVAVVALNSREEVLMVRQFRYAVGEEIMEIPAGKMEPGEDPESTARRELSEETGYEAASWRRLTSFYSTPGFTTEKLYLYLALDLKYTGQHTDEDEFVQVESIPLEKALYMIESEEIKDAKTIVGLLAAKHILDKK